MKSSRALLNRIQTTCIVSFSLAVPQIWFQIHLRLLESLSRYIVCTRTLANCQRLYHLCIIQLFSIDYVKCAMLYFFCLKKNLFLYVTNENKRYKTFWSYHKTIKGIFTKSAKILTYERKAVCLEKKLQHSKLFISVFWLISMVHFDCFCKLLVEY